MAKKVSKVIAGVGAASVMAVGAGATALASSSSTTSAPAAQGQHNGQHKGHHRGTPVSGTAKADVLAAIKKKDSSITVKDVFKGPKGNFHAVGTKAGKRVHVDVSSNYQTVTVRTGGPHAGGHPQHGFGHHGKAATAAQTASVESTVKAKDPAVSINKVFVSPKGGFNAAGAENGKRVRVHVSADLKTVTVRAGHAHAGQPAGANTGA